MVWEETVSVAGQPGLLSHGFRSSRRLRGKDLPFLKKIAFPHQISHFPEN